MNDLQQIASFVSGYHPKEDFTGAQDDGYYESDSKKECIDYLVTLSEELPRVFIINELEAEQIYEFLLNDFADSSERYHAFITLTHITPVKPYANT